MTDINVMTLHTRSHLASLRPQLQAEGETARGIVRDGLRDVRVATGETTHAAETYQPRHAHWDAPAVTTGQEAGR